MRHCTLQLILCKTSLGISMAGGMNALTCPTEPFADDVVQAYEEKSIKSEVKDKLRVSGTTHAGLEEDLKMSRHIKALKGLPCSR